jgi:hypothetical protein
MRIEKPPFDHRGTPAALWTGRTTKADCMASVRGGCMADTKTVIAQAYSAFNKRDIDGALELMTQDVNWPKASEGGKVVGKEEMRRIELQQLLDKPTKKNRTRFIQRVVLRSALVFPRRHLIDDIATGERL